MKIFISGLVNVETNVRVGKFPIEYAPIHYPFFGIESNVSGVAFNVAKALKTLGNNVLLNTITGNDEAAERISAALKSLNIASKIETVLNATHYRSSFTTIPGSGRFIAILRISRSERPTFRRSLRFSKAAPPPFSATSISTGRCCESLKPRAFRSRPTFMR